MDDHRHERQVPPLLLATTNPGKIREMRQLLRDLRVRLVSPAELGLNLDVEETGTTFQENAGLKARAYFAASGIPCLAEDSGFEVDFLDGQPGVQSARWEGDDYARKNRLIVEMLAGQRGMARRCRYVAVMAFIDPGGTLHFSRGEVIGQIADAPRGDGGFGYDPIFFVARYKRTMAELTPEEKDRISHRGKAIARIRGVIERAARSPRWSGRAARD
ncbi:MAG: RdgB/HAM1 family non-canonical purine NTP pyrophosphatase [Chloroflexi bacterium]|nr:RdgB/HAM1 family non-canonical purine NTP pyrophosphatase [Chloroflexota bacterium]